MNTLLEKHKEEGWHISHAEDIGNGYRKRNNYKISEKRDERDQNSQIQSALFIDYAQYIEYNTGG